MYGSRVSRPKSSDELITFLDFSLINEWKSNEKYQKWHERFVIFLMQQEVADDK